jgi:hypothetical protein
VPLVLRAWVDRRLGLPVGHLALAPACGESLAELLESPVVAIHRSRSLRIGDVRNEEARTGFEPVYEALQASA